MYKALSISVLLVIAFIVGIVAITQDNKKKFIENEMLAKQVDDYGSGTTDITYSTKEINYLEGQAGEIKDLKH